MKVNQISIGRFHHFHLARQLEKHELLEGIWTGYPKFKLKDELDIPTEKIHSFPWLHTMYMTMGKFDLNKWHWFDKEISWKALETLDKYVSAKIKIKTILIALSGSGLYSGSSVQKLGGIHICDRGSSHIKFQNQILREEFARWGLCYRGIDVRTIEKEMSEYEQANYITVPSNFVKDSFINMGVSPDKIHKIVYGANLKRFNKIADPSTNIFRILWVGSVSIRKGFMYLLNAFQKLNHPKKELLVIGNVTSDIKSLLISQDLTGVTFKGQVQNSELPYIYSSANVFVLPSLEEGLAMVQGEALACGCPVIATTNTGSDDLFTHRREGFIIPIRSESAILECLNELVDDSELRLAMSESAINQVTKLGGWDAYGNDMAKLLNSINN